MSVADVDKIDGIAISNDDEQRPILLLTDHLDWTNEYEHLILLQEKINAYVGFLESKQYEEIYPHMTFSLFYIEVHFKYELTDSCIKLIENINKLLLQNNIIIEIIVS